MTSNRVYRICKKSYADDSYDFEVQYTDNFDFWNLVSKRNNIIEARALVHYCKNREVTCIEEVWRD